MTRLVLARFARASVRTLRATPAERVTLCRNGLAELGMLPEYTTPHHFAPRWKRNNSGAEGYRFEPYRADQAPQQLRAGANGNDLIWTGSSPTRHAGMSGRPWASSWSWPGDLGMSRPSSKPRDVSRTDGVPRLANSSLGSAHTRRTWARQRTPKEARRWGYLMNMPLDSFGTLFEKHARLS